jgi:N-acetylgalactosamine-N,N'-diacetylbacillosaminyl-diphospho-undecaprenol 4-alpha-N-acetylgalactosaminyltransferase
VVFVIGNLGVGGVTRILVSLANNLPRLQPAVAVRVAEGGLVRELDASVPLFTLANGKLVSQAARDSAPNGGTRPPRGLGLKSAVDFWREVLGLRRIVRSTGADTVSTFIMRAHLAALVTRTLVIRRLRVVVNVQAPFSEQAHDDYPRPVERRLMRLFVRHLLSRADVIVVPAAAVRDDMVGNFGVPADRIEVVPNPVDLDLVRARAAETVEPWAERSHGRRLLVGAGRLIPLKGYHTLIEALPLLPPDVHAIVMGEGPERKALESQAERLGVSERVRLVGDKENPWSYMARAEVFAHPSRSEAQSLAFVEAMTLGIPIVSTSESAGIRESLDQGRRGLLVPPSDARALADAIARLLAEPSLRESLVRRGRTAAEQHALAAVATRHEEILESN